MSSRERQEGAWRLFEALSGVDEELLARSQEKGGARPWLSPKRVRTLSVCAGFAACALVMLCLNEVLLSPRYQSGDSAAPQLLEEAPMEMSDVTGGWETGGAYSGAVPRTEVSGEGAVVGAEDGGAAKDAPEYAGNGTGDNGQEQQLQNREDLDAQRPVTNTQPTESVSGQNGVRELTLEEAGALEGVGAYIPTKLPGGYQWESALYQEEEGGGTLSLRWMKGMDYISLFIKIPDAAELSGLQITDVAKPETYDVRLYEIPYGETVPQEYWQQFDNPVFREEDFGQEVVEARMETVQDAGDTGTPRGNFAVLYDSGVLVRFIGRGNAGDIWEMFQSMNP